MALNLSEAETGSKLKKKLVQPTEYTKVFDDWQPSVRSFFLSRVAMEEGEVPVFAHFKPITGVLPVLRNILGGGRQAQSWFLLTTRRVAWGDQDQAFCELRHKEIESAGYSSGPVGWLGRHAASPPDTLVYARNGLGDCRHYSPWMHILDTSGTRYEILLELGNIIAPIKQSIYLLSVGSTKAYERALEANRESASKQLVRGSDEYLAARVEKVFLGYQQSGHCCLFRNLEPSWHEYFLAEAALVGAEQPMIAIFLDRENWFLATSRRIIWSKPAFRHDMEYRDINGFGQTEVEAFRLSNPFNAENAEAWQEKYGSLLLTSEAFHICDVRGERYESVLPGGLGIFAVIATLHKMLRLDRTYHPEKYQRG